MQADPDSVWVGRTALDGVVRVHGFHRVADRDLAVVVAVDRDEAMQATKTWAVAAYVFAGGITALLLILAAICARYPRRAPARGGARSRTRRPGIGQQPSWKLPRHGPTTRPCSWRRRLPACRTAWPWSTATCSWSNGTRASRRSPACRRPCCASACRWRSIIRAQAAAGVFGDVDIEAEVARRMAALRAGNYRRHHGARHGRTAAWSSCGATAAGRRLRHALYRHHRAQQTVNALREASALAEAANKAMSRFVAIVSHEIRTPLNALLNSLSLLADSGMAATQQVLLDTARQSGDALLALINDILEMSRMEAGQLALRPERVRAAPADRERDGDVQRPGGGTADRAADVASRAACRTSCTRILAGCGRC